MDASPTSPAAVLGIAYPSFYFADLDRALTLYEAVFGPAAYREEGLAGIRLGDTWLTLFGPERAPASGHGPRNAEIGVRLARPADVDALHARFLERGARSVMAPQDTWMYEDLRYACLDDPLGIRWDLCGPQAAPPAR